MGIEETAAFTVRCDDCGTQLLRKTRPQKFDSDPAAARFANAHQWLVTSTSVQCPECKYFTPKKKLKTEE